MPLSSSGRAYCWDCTPYCRLTRSCKISASPKVSKNPYSGSSPDNRRISSRSSTTPTSPSSTGTITRAAQNPIPKESSRMNAPNAPSM